MGGGGDGDGDGDWVYVWGSRREGGIVVLFCFALLYLFPFSTSLSSRLLALERMYVWMCFGFKA